MQVSRDLKNERTEAFFLTFRTPSMRILRIGTARGLIVDDD